MLIVFEFNFFIFLQKVLSFKEIILFDVIVFSEVKFVFEMLNFLFDLEDLMLELIKFDLNFVLMIQLELILILVDNIKEE